MGIVGKCERIKRKELKTNKKKTNVLRGNREQEAKRLWKPSESKYRAHVAKRKRARLPLLTLQTKIEVPSPPIRHFVGRVSLVCLVLRGAVSRRPDATRDRLLVVVVVVVDVVPPDMYACRDTTLTSIRESMCIRYSINPASLQMYCITENYRHISTVHSVETTSPNRPAVFLID